MKYWPCFLMTTERKKRIYTSVRWWNNQKGSRFHGKPQMVGNTLKPFSSAARSSNKLRRFFQSFAEVRKGKGNETLTFNLSFSCYVHLNWCSWSATLHIKVNRDRQFKKCQWLIPKWFIHTECVFQITEQCGNSHNLSFKTTTSYAFF